MVRICHEFFQINDIKANVGKYELSKDKDLEIDGTKIEKMNHEEDKDVNHRIKGGNVEVIDLMSKKEILKSAQSRRTKGVLFLEQVLESDKKHLMKNLDKKNIHLKLFDEDEKVNNNNIVTWNDEKGRPMFGVDKKNKKSKNYKRIRSHLILRNKDEV
ncbi:hypothetical protein RhiirC2_783825 [Rhizophagus irregularis]|uniref:Uncharacterized protein n=1 Tax=Rhizophagus irregularis TaxID=588596 RepID=A0A2N1N001_9GLOM|nr:hypothetical protein RhiirC2_783825 [Rhizophagus irregularis]